MIFAPSRFCFQALAQAYGLKFIFYDKLFYLLASSFRMSLFLF
jgi:hypothetical protein